MIARIKMTDGWIVDADIGDSTLTGLATFIDSCWQKGDTLIKIKERNGGYAHLNIRHIIRIFATEPPTESEVLE